MSDKQKIWHLVEIETVTEAEEAVEYALNELDSLGTQINDPGKETTGNLQIIGYFEKKIEDGILHDRLNKALQIYGLTSDAVKNFVWREIADRDWLSEWKKHWRPTETGKFIIAPLWEKIENTEKIIIRIEPSMAFGTGTHETTRLCLKAIEESYNAGESFLDVGTGTGILAIAAAKLKSEVLSLESEVKNKKTQDFILACDTDENALEIAELNALINKTENIEFYAGSISADSPQFDFVCANLTADVILPLLPLLLEKSKRILVLSGILKEQEKQIVSELERLGIENPKIETDGEWISVQVKR